MGKEIVTNMSGPTEPYASGYGILLGIAILWTAVFVLMLVCKAIFFPAEKPTEEPVEEARLPVPVLDRAIGLDFGAARRAFEHAYSTTHISGSRGSVRV